MAESCIEIITKMMHIFLRGFSTMFFFKHFAEFENAGNIVSFSFFILLINPFVNFPVFLACPFDNLLNVFINFWYDASPVINLLVNSL